MAFRSTYSPNFDCLVRLGNQGIPIGNNTLAAWVRFDNLSATYEVIEITDSGGTSFASAILSNGTQIEYSQRNAAGTQINFLGPTTLSANTWYHVALTWDGTTLRGYLNGAPNGTSTGLTGARGNWADLQVGPTLGYLQDAVFYTEALSAAEITQLYRGRMPKRRTNLFAHLPCFPGAANRRIDYSGNGNNFTDNGTPADSTIEGPQVGWATSAVRPTYHEADGSTVTFSGTATSTTAATGSTKIKNQFAGTAASTSSCTGTLQVRKFFTATACTSPTAATATLAVKKVFGGVCTTPTACTGTERVKKIFAGVCTTPTACAGSLTLLGVVAFAGTATSPTACTATVNVRKTASGVCTTSSACTATLRIVKPVSGAIASPSACTGTLRVKKFFTALVTTPTACTGILSGGTVLTPAAPEDPRNTQRRRSMAIGLYRRHGRH
jgi:hypothetical protein